MTIDVLVTVISDEDRSSTEGVVRTDITMVQMRKDIVKAFSLGNPDDWDLALIPANAETSLSRYTPVDGDQLLLVKRTMSQGPGFWPKETSDPRTSK